MNPQGFRILETTKDRIDLAAKVRNVSRSEVVAQLLRSASGISPRTETKRVQVSYSLSAELVEKLRTLSKESQRSQAEIIDFLAGDASLN